MIRRPPRSTRVRSSAASDVYKYSDEWLQTNRMFKEKFKSNGSDGGESNFGTASTHHTCPIQDEKRNFKLPKIELKKFNGEFEDWLGWWTQFSKIHEDKRIHEADKFQYLVQSMVPGTRSSNLVKSYPATVENYPKVIEALTERFGDKAMLAEVYIRKLQSVVLGLDKNKSKFDLCRVSDDIETQLRCLESLKVTLDHSAFMLPLIESTLPVELIKLWQHCPDSGYLDEDEKKSTEERLKSLLKFMKREVKNEERIKMIQGKSAETGGNNTRSRRGNNDGPTSQSLHSNSTTSCIFCGKGNHASQKCFHAKDMSLEEKDQKVRAGRVCFYCLKSGHNARDCTAKVECNSCKGKHYVIMCRKKEKAPNNEDDEPPTEEMDSMQINSTAVS